MKNPDALLRSGSFLSNEIKVGTGILIDKDAVPQGEGVRLDDFYAIMPKHQYLFVPTREPWPASSVNARIADIAAVDGDGDPVLNDKGEQVFIKASRWLDENRPVEQMTWAPGHPMVVVGHLIAEGGWIERPGINCFNLYRPPIIRLGNPENAGRWLDHVEKLYGDDADHIVKWLAHRAQRPQEKINHALVLGGNQGIGKDSLLEPVKKAIGPWNFIEASPQQMLGRFNGFVKSVILRINEARDLGDTNRFAFYDHMKALTVAPPDVLRVDEKNLREHSVLNICGVIITTNYKSDGIYLPPDDRRHFVAWSNLDKEDFSPDYWNDLYRYYENGGDRDVAAYLNGRDISSFDPKAPPPKTEAFWEIVNGNRAPEEAELADVLDVMGRPDAITREGMIDAANQIETIEWLKDRRNRRSLPHRLEKCGYVTVRNPDAVDGQWSVQRKRRTIYSKADLSRRDQLLAAQTMVGRSNR